MAEYAIPNWIQPPDIAAQYYRGLELGQQAASEQQKLQFQQMQSERDHMLELQRMQINKSYQDQQIQLRQQEVKQQQERINLETQDASRKLEGWRNFQSAVQRGEDAVQAAMKYLPGTGEVGGVGTLATAFEKQRQMTKGGGEAHVETFGGHQFLVVPGEYGQRPQYHSLAPDASERVYNVQEISELQRQRDKVDAQIAKMEENVPHITDPETGTENDYAKSQRRQYEALKARSEQMDKDIDEARARARGGRSGLAAPPTVEPAPMAEPQRRPWDATPGAATGVGFQVPTTQEPGPGPAFNGKVVAIRPKAATPSSAPAAAAAPSGPGTMQRAMTGPYFPQSAPTAAPPTIAPPAQTPSSAPSIPLYDPTLTPNTANYGQAVRTAQSGLSKSLADLMPEELTIAAKRLGVGDLTWDPDRKMYFGSGLFNVGKQREDLESQLLKLATEKNMDPLQ